MAFALAVPAFAEGVVLQTPLDESGCNYTVAPIGKAYYVIVNGEEDFAADVFDQAVTITMPEDVGKFTEVYESAYYSGSRELPINKDGSVTLPADAPAAYYLHFSRSIEEDGEPNDEYIVDEYIVVWTKVYLGKELVAENHANFEYKFVPAGPTTPTQPSTPTTPSTPSAVKPAPGTTMALTDGTNAFLYTVKAGDTLSGIAGYYYGNANVYRLIYEINKSILPSANMIYAGQTIVLPSYAAAAAVGK